jgi:hypothetical protein
MLLKQLYKTRTRAAILNAIPSAGGGRERGRWPGCLQRPAHARHHPGVRLLPACAIPRGVLLHCLCSICRLSCLHACHSLQHAVNCLPCPILSSSSDSSCTQTSFKQSASCVCVSVQLEGILFPIMQRMITQDGQDVFEEVRSCHTSIWSVLCCHQCSSCKFGLDYIPLCNATSCSACAHAHNSKLVCNVWHEEQSDCTAGAGAPGVLHVLLADDQPAALEPVAADRDSPQRLGGRLLRECALQTCPCICCKVQTASSSHSTEDVRMWSPVTSQ